VLGAQQVAKVATIRHSSSALKLDADPQKAAIAVAAALLTAAYHMLKNGTFHQDLGADFVVKRDQARVATKLANRIKDLGYNVSITPAA
jgi:transposase